MLFFRKSKKSKVLDNPRIFEPTPKFKPKVLTRIKFFSALTIVLAATLIWFLLYSPYFQVKNILIEGDALEETRVTIEQLKGRNIFLIGGRKAEKDLQEKQPWIKSIKIIRGIPDTVRVRLIERDAAFAWKTGQNIYLIDKEGVVFKQVSESKLLTIIDNRNAPVTFGQKVVTTDFIDFIDAANQAIPLQTQIKIQSMAIEETTFHVSIMTDKNFKIIFDALRPLQRQIDDFNTFYSQKKDELKEYADLRVEGVLYYK